ncbi:MAG: hypothetical protein JO303_12645 [Caulobacteraceae bacterium]|nr:hypothetical protein [Caulobacteraceae bacterium]
MKKVVSGMAMGIAAFIATSSAHAAISITNVSGDVKPAGFTNLVTFDSALPSGYSLSGTYSLFTSSQSNAAAPPGDTTTFAGLQTGQSLTLHSEAGFTAFSFYMGSPDSYNQVTAAGQTFAGSDLLGTPFIADNGDQSVGRTVIYDLGAVAHDVTFSSNGVAFEFDNVAVAVAAAPEPAEWMLMLLGVGGLGLALRAHYRLNKELDGLRAAA